jgi:hypothetical protein
MSAHDIGQRAGIGGNAADIEATLVAGLAVDGALRFNRVLPADLRDFG